MQKPRISAIAAIGKGPLHTHIIGKENHLLWHIPDDLKRFKALTLGHPVIMGRKTFDSVISSLGKPLPGRANIVVTRDPSWNFEGVLVAHSLEEAFEKAHGIDKEEIFIGGGSQLYEQALPFIDRLYLTLIDDEKEGDSYFPSYENEFTKTILDEAHEWNGLSYRWVDLERA